MTESNAKNGGVMRLMDEDNEKVATTSSVLDQVDADMRLKLESDPGSLMRIVEKRIQDSKQDAAAEEAATEEEEDEEEDAAMDQERAMLDTSDAGLDSLTLEKLVAARISGASNLGSQAPVNSARRTASEEDFASLLTEEQQQANAAIADARQGAFSKIKAEAKQEVQPGAYAHAPSTQPVRAQQPRLSLLGRQSSDQDRLLDISNVSDADVEAALNDIDSDHVRRSKEGASGRQREQDCSSTSRVSVGGSSAGMLSVATPIEDEEDPANLPRAEAYQGKGEEEQEVEEKSSRECKEFGKAMVFLVVLLAAALLAVFLIRSSSGGGDSSDNGESDNSLLRTMKPGVPSTLAPTLSDGDYVLQLLPSSTVRTIQLHPDTSPQAQALDWILNDPVASVQSYLPARLLQRFALATLYYATQGDSWHNNTDWLDYHSHECSWFSRHWFEDVELYMSSSTANTFTLMYDSRTYPCSQNTTGGDFEHLWIYKNNLDGTLPIVELSLMTSLKSMSLFGNNDLRITITSELGLLTNLEGVEFSQLGVQGSIPTEIGLMSNLSAILVGANDITGTIPTEYGLLTSLIYSMLSQNSLTGTLPSELGTMSSLEWLYLYGNQLSGSFPMEFFTGRSSTMKLLNMYSNQLSGSLPTEVGLFTNLELVSITDNQMTGTLPTELGLLSNIQHGLSMKRNNFEGTIPTELGSLQNLTGVVTGSGTYGLGLGGNQLTGTVPSELGRLSVLERLYLEDNFLTGSLPEELANMDTLETFYAQNNNFVGPAFPSLLLDAHQNISIILEWNVSGNPYLTGSIPEILCESWLFDCSDVLCGCGCDCPAV